MEPILIELVRKPLDLILGFGVYVAAFIALTIGLISLRIQNKARKERTKQEKHKANKLRVKISRELLDLIALYKDAKNTGSMRFENLILNQSYPIDDLRAVHNTLEHLHGLDIMLDPGEVALLEWIIDTTRVFVHNSQIDIETFNKTSRYIVVLRKLLWEAKRATKHPITRKELDLAVKARIEQERENEENRNS